MQGVDSDALEVLVRSFYTGTVPLSLEAAPAVYDAAHKLQVRMHTHASSKEDGKLRGRCPEGRDDVWDWAWGVLCGLL